MGEATVPRSKALAPSCPRPTRRSRGRGLCFCVLRLVMFAAPLNASVGRVEERAKARRAAGSTALFGRGCAGRESIRLHHVLFWALVAVRGVSVCSSPPVFQPGVVQAVRPPSPRSTLPGFQAGPPAFVFGSVGGRSIVPARSPTRRSRGRGVTLWPVFSEFSPPAPLSFGVGRVEERAKARRAAGSTALFGRGCAGRESIRLHHVLFWALVVVRGVSVCSSPPVFQPGVVQAVRPPSPRSTLPGFQAGPPAFVFGSVGGRSIVPARSPTRRSRGRGVTIWPVSPSSVRPRPLALALGGTLAGER